MAVAVSAIMGAMERFAPRRFAAEWDNVGLMVGDPNAMVEKVMVGLDADPDTIDAAITTGADLLVVHHPFIFHPLTTVRTDQRLGRSLARAVTAGLNIFSAHTNLDVVAGGVSDVLARGLGLDDLKILAETGREDLVKLVVFVPASHAEQVRAAIAGAGAGFTGGYSDCSFATSGTGSFRPHEGTHPFQGKVGQLARVDEVRLETILPTPLRDRVVRAMLSAHPYEEVAYDLYPLLNAGRPVGFGRVGHLSAPVSLRGFTTLVKERLSVAGLTYAGDPERQITKVAVCGGSGGEFTSKAAFSGADVYLVGEMKYHDVQEALACGMAVVAAGHDVTERVIVSPLAEYLRQELGRVAKSVTVTEATITALWQYA